MPHGLPSGKQIEIRAGNHRSDNGVRVTSTATNVGRDTCPFESGAHPYLTVGTETVDTVVLRAPGRTVVHFDARGLPVDNAPVDGTEYDFRAPREIGATKLDNAFTDLDRRSLAVEPMTCPPNAFRTGESVLVLEPGESTTTEWGIQV